jgi:hypothetical protein
MLTHPHRPLPRWNDAWRRARADLSDHRYKVADLEHDMVDSFDMEGHRD